MKRTLIALLAMLLLLTPVLAGCQDKQPILPPTNTEAPTEEGGEAETSDELTPGLEAIPYDRDVWVLQREAVDGALLRDEWNPKNEKIIYLQEAMISKNEYLQDKYAIEFKNYYQHINSTKEVSQKILANERICDFMSTTPAMLTVLASNEALHPIQNVPNVNLAAPWWYTDLNESLSYRDINFFTFGSANITSLWTSSCVWYNMKLAESLNIGENIFDVVNNRDWTLEKLLEIAALCPYMDAPGDGSGELSNADRFAISQTAGGWYNAFFGSGLSFTSRDEEGRWKVDVSGESISTRLGKIITYQNNKELAIPLTAAAYGIDQWQSFKDGNALFLIEFICVFNTVKEATFEYTLLPSPLLTQGQEKFYTTFHMTHASAFAVPITAEESDLDMIGRILEDTNYMAKKEQWPAFYDTMLKGHAAKNPQSVKMIEYIFEGLTMDPAMLYSVAAGSIDQTVRTLISEGNSTNITSSLEPAEQIDQGVLNDVMNKIDEILAKKPA